MEYKVNRILHKSVVSLHDDFQCERHQAFPIFYIVKPRKRGVPVMREKNHPAICYTIKSLTRQLLDIPRSGLL